MVVAETPMHYDITYDTEYGGRGLKDIKAFLEKKGIKAHYTYAAKCPKPSKDFKIKPADIKICSDTYLKREIELVQPKHIIVLGANAMYGAWKKKGITEKMGNKHWDEKLQAHIYPTVHQAQALYSQEQKDTLLRDLSRFVKWIKGDEDDQPVMFEPPVYLASTLKSLRKLQRLIRENGGVVACDTETSGLNPYAPDFRVRTIQFCFDAEFGGVFVPLDLESNCYFEEKDEATGKMVRTKAVFWDEGETLEEAMEIVREILLESKIIWHNGKYDRISLYMWGKHKWNRPVICGKILADTMHMAHLIDENRRLGLKKLITSVLGFPSYDIGDKLTRNISELLPYATRDTVATLLLYHEFCNTLAQPEYAKIRKFYRKVVRRMDHVFTKMELRGWPVNLQRAIEANATLDTKIDEVEAAMLKALRKQGIDDFTEKDFASPTKLAPLIFERLGYKPSEDKRIALTESGGLSTNEDALVHLKHKPFISELLEWRGLTKAQSTYVEPMIKAAKNRGVITTSYKLSGTVTGRTASGKEGKGKTANGMNLQNIPPTHGIKACIKPEDGWVIVECDFSQIELRIAGELSGDRSILWAYQNGIDLHTFRAMRVLGVEQDEWDSYDPAKKKDARRKAKPVNFGFLYGMMAKKFQQFALTDYDMEFTMRECQDMRDGFFHEHRDLERWYKKQEKEALTHGYVESLSGRRRHLPDTKLDPSSSKEARSKYLGAIRQAINTPVQGFASDLKLMSLIEIDDYLGEFREHDMDPGIGYLIGEVHDSVVLVVKAEHAEMVARRVLKIMQHPLLLDELGIELKVPIEAEASIGPSLGETVERKDLVPA
jgi:uracil-DNA glycosylase family 4